MTGWRRMDEGGGRCTVRAREEEGGGKNGGKGRFRGGNKADEGC